MSLPTIAIPLNLHGQTFNQPLEVLDYVARHPHAESNIQGDVHSQLERDPNFKQWRSLRTLRRKTPHFRRYRVGEFDKYHQASSALAEKRATSGQEALARGLGQEILGSRLTVPPGQMLFHGRADGVIHPGFILTTFLSTSFCPVIALNSARRRAGYPQRSRSCVYILSSEERVPIHWGQSGNTAEYEILFCAGMSFRRVVRHSSLAWPFDVIEASLGDRRSIWA
jgi:hypothetical protein